jgi:uncharacterized protein (TIGR03437 family)
MLRGKEEVVMGQRFLCRHGGTGIVWCGSLTFFVLILLQPAGFAAPRINSIVNAATFGGVGPAAGSLATIFGTELATSVRTANSIPLPEQLASTRVNVGGVAAPLLYVSPTQINFQVPWQVCCPGGGVAVSVSVAPNLSNVFTLDVSASGPAVFMVDLLTGQGAVLIANTNIYAASVGSVPGAPARPALRGEFLTVYCVGLGPVSNSPPSGTAASSDSPSRVLDPVQVRVGGAVASAILAGLAPNFVGLYQVDFQVPFNAPIGAAIPLTVTVSNLPLSFPVRIAVN